MNEREGEGKFGFWNGAVLALNNLVFNQVKTLLMNGRYRYVRTGKMSKEE